MNRTRLSPATKHAVRSMVALVACLCWTSADLHAQTKTWDGIHGTQKIEVTVVYFVPSDRKPLADWKDRVDYYCRRIKQFHAREFQGQSRVEINLHPKPFVSKWSTPELRRGDPDAIFFRTLGEIDKRFDFGSESEDGFPILLVLSDINHRPLDDFYRLKPGDIEPVFEGIVTRINPVAEEGTRTIPVYVTIDNADGLLLGGMFASGQIVIEQAENALAVPSVALRETADGLQVLRISDGRLNAVSVEVGGEWAGALTRITAGLNVGDRVVTAPLPALRHGDAVQIVAE